MSELSLRDAWRQRLAAFTPGELTVAEWCRQQRVTENQYHYWRKRLATEQAPDKAAPAGFVPLQLHEPAPTPAASAGVSVRIGSATIELQPGFDLPTLQAVLQMLEAARC